MSYQKLLQISKTAALYNDICSLLGWDQETYMPLEGIEMRSVQIEQITGLIHKEKTSKRFANLLGNLIDLETGHILCGDLTPAQCASLREWRRDYLQSIKLPSSFVREMAQISSASTHAWREAKETSNFALFLPHLKKIVSFCRKKADILGYSAHPYDALVDLFEPETKTATLDALFNRLKMPLLALVKAISVKLEPNASFLHFTYPPAKQLNLAINYSRQWDLTNPSFAWINPHIQCVWGPIQPMFG